ncbi:hypothetical protein GCK72_009204 [Caenorhabditis remanei]|uniref:3'-5' exonuclease domain-containing protein n=1 Tax=Caenorhabditis remanei TaxID=31234 RepID=A0A6A5H1R0_CAERE|nr:hypothetical protein GCK72_009204 [Caenorhabditis remanei]KAF1760951.1 hypothetical protein GCK72_009204 [Caenorhabditis remanei]
MELLKTETMSDWNAPRLRDDQVWYAAMDATSLIAIQTKKRDATTTYQRGFLELEKCFEGILEYAEPIYFKLTAGAIN